MAEILSYAFYLALLLYIITAESEIFNCNIDKSCSNTDFYLASNTSNQEQEITEFIFDCNGYYSCNHLSIDLDFDTNTTQNISILCDDTTSCDSLSIFSSEQDAIDKLSINLYDKCIDGISVLCTEDKMQCEIICLTKNLWD